MSEDSPVENPTDLEPPELLTEHRQALITAAVTGRMEVPGVAAS